MMRVFVTVTLFAAGALTSSPTMACAPGASTAPTCTQQLTIVDDSDGFTIRPRDERPARMPARVVLPPHRLGTSTWLDNAMIEVTPPILSSDSAGHGQ